MPSIETHTVTLVDVPLVQRLGRQGLLLNSQAGLTEDVWGLNSTLFSSIPFTRGLCTLLARSSNQDVVGQFRYRTDETNAHILYVAPKLNPNYEDTVWLHLLDAMTHEAGKRGAHNLVAEVEEEHSMFEIMRHAGFAVYGRQTIWRHLDYGGSATENIVLERETEADAISITSLLNNTIPAIVYSVLAPCEMDETIGYVYRKKNRVEGYIAVTEGKNGIYILPCFHPNVEMEAEAILKKVILLSKRSRKMPVYVCIRAYQGWLNHVLQNLSFESWLSQAVMVRHIAAGVRQPNFKIQLQSAWHTSQKSVSPPASSLQLCEKPKEGCGKG